MSDSISFDKFEVTTLVDVDGYIVDETTDVVIAFKEGNLKKIALLIQENNFEIEKEQIIDFPTMDASNTITMEELSKEMPKNFEDILK